LTLTRNTRSSRRSLIGADLIAVLVKFERSNASGQRAVKLAKRDSTARRRVSAPRRTVLVTGDGKTDFPSDPAGFAAVAEQS